MEWAIGETREYLDGVVKVERRSDDYYIAYVGDKTHWSGSQTPDEAIGAVCRVHPEALLHELVKNFPIPLLEERWRGQTKADQEIHRVVCAYDSVAAGNLDCVRFVLMYILFRRKSCGEELTILHLCKELEALIVWAKNAQHALQ